MNKVAAALAALVLAAGARADVNPANFDPGVKPQNDFFRYVNGAWLRRTPIPTDFSRWGTLDELHQANLEKLHLLCERASAQGSDASPDEQKVGDFYATGMDAGAADDTGIQPIAFEFERISALATPADVLGEIGHMHSIGIPAGFVFTSGIDAQNSGFNIAVVRQGGLGLPDRDLYLRGDKRSESLRAQYADHISRMFQILGDEPALAQTEAAAVVRLETALARASLGPVALRDPYASYHKVSIADAEQQVPGFDWRAYFAKTGAPAFDEFNLAQPEFFKAFAGALTSNPVRDWKSYLRWHVIHAFAPYVGGRFVAENFSFYGTALTGATHNLPRWKQVVMTIDASMGDALGQLYVADYFSPDAKAAALKMTDNIRDALRQRLQDATWMDEATRSRAVAKLDALTVKIGYPETWLDYSALYIDRGPYVLNVLKAKSFEARRELRKIGHPVDRGEWPVTPATTNAHYDPARNEIVLPAAMLQAPLFDPAADDAVNYGAIGAIIGFEMTHGFDDVGRMYDASGNLADWWTPESAARFKQRAAAIVRQFDGYYVLPGVHLNGELTEGENIADLGGVRLAYAALESDLGDAPRTKIGGFTPEQRFFISFASLWKGKSRSDALRLQVDTSPDAPSEFRCNAPLSNMDAFAEAFAVPEGSPMRRPPSQQVLIW